jgi:hypothetical protein
MRTTKLAHRTRNRFWEQIKLFQPHPHPSPSHPQLNFEEFTDNLRGGKRTDSFYDTFPDIKADARTFVVRACSRKSAEFKIMDLAHFIDAKYYELTGLKKQNSNELIKSESSCRLNLRRWELNLKQTRNVHIFKVMKEMTW